MPDETEWYFKEWYHLYYCPFCGVSVKGNGTGNFDEQMMARRR